MDILRAAFGLAVFIGLAWLISDAKRRIDWRLVALGLTAQIFLAWIIQLDAGQSVLQAMSDGITRFLSFAAEGATFVFGPLTQYEAQPAGEAGPGGAGLFPPWTYGALGPEREGKLIPVFAFRILPTIIFFSCIMGMLYHLGIIQRVVGLLARGLRALLRVSGAESLAMAANVFIGQTEAPLVVRPYIKLMTRSELMALMTGGFATIAGSVLAAYIGILGPEYVPHLLAASFMSAPAAFIMAKIMIPETEQPVTRGEVAVSLPSESNNVLDAAARGTAEGLTLALNVGAMIIAFVAVVALINWPLEAIGEAFGMEGGLSLQIIFGTVFWPLAWAMGVPTADCFAFGSLMGTKIAVTEFLAFEELSKLPTAGADAISDKARFMAAYALCGFANFASVGIQLGGIGPLAPERRAELSRLAFRALLGGAFASWMTATIAGAFL